MNQEFYYKICEAVGSDNVRLKEPMSRHTTFRVGGPADYFVYPHRIQEIENVLRLCYEYQIPKYIIGNGSNLLVSDSGYRGAVIQIYKNMASIHREGNRLTAQAGVLLAKLASTAYESGLTGLEFASGIPGTVGGAVVMNAGAYGGEIKDVCTSVTMLTPEGHVEKLENGRMEFGYRTSAVAKRQGIVLEAVFELKPGEKETIRTRMEELKEARCTKQPLEYPSAGSTFKRPEGYYAGKLIMDAGLRGYRRGGAMVSEKHCGFVINYDHATAADILQLIRDVQNTVREKFGVELEREVKTLGSFEDGGGKNP